MEGPPYLCISCKHLTPGTSRFGEKPTCAAFPGGIPYDILNGGDHTHPIEGDNGITYEVDPGLEGYFKIWDEFRKANTQ